MAISRYSETIPHATGPGFQDEARGTKSSVKPKWT
jgi:hypothetical protein